VGVGGPWRVSTDELMDKNLRYFVGGNLATLEPRRPAPGTTPTQPRRPTLAPRTRSTAPIRTRSKCVLLYRMGQKNRTVFRLDNFVMVSPRKACSISKFSQFYREKRVQNSHFSEFKYSLPDLLKSSQQLKLWCI